MVIKEPRHHLQRLFIPVDPLVRYYRHQAGRSKNNGIRPVYATPLVLQRDYGIGSFLSGLWRVVRPIIWSGAKALGRETLRTGGNILTDIARSSSDQNPRDIVSRHVIESTQNLIAKLRGRGRKRKRNGKTVKPRASKKPRLTKRDIFA